MRKLAEATRPRNDSPPESLRIDHGSINLAADPVSTANGWHIRLRGRSAFGILRHRSTVHHLSVGFRG